MAVLSYPSQELTVRTSQTCVECYVTGGTDTGSVLALYFFSTELQVLSEISKDLS